MDNFDHLVTMLRAGLLKALVWGDGKLYTTDAKGGNNLLAHEEDAYPSSDMVASYLGGFSDPAWRQYHNCSCCKDFLNKYGTLAVMKDGMVASALFSFINDTLKDPVAWNVGQEFGPALAAMCDRVLKAKITGVFVSDQHVLGTPETKDGLGAPVWKHFAVTNPLPYTGRKLTAGQRRAELLEEHGMLSRNLVNYSQEAFTQAVALLDTETLYRSDKFLGLAQKLLALKQATSSLSGARRSNLIWQAVAQGDPAVAHFNTGVISTLLDDLQTGLDFSVVKKKFDAKTDALNYQVSKAPPKAGQVKAAENLVAKLGLAPALERRYATVDEVSGTSLWKWEGVKDGRTATRVVEPHPNLQQVAKPVFGHLLAQPKAAAPFQAGAKLISWDKFRGLMMTAEAIQFLAQDGLSYGAITTGPEVEGTQLFKHAGPLSTVAWTAADADQFGLAAGCWNPVSMIVPSPADKEACLFVLPWLADKQADKLGLGLFTELLHGDLREARSTISAHSAKGVLGGQNVLVPLAMGVIVSKRLTLGMTFRVTKLGVAVDYTVDRWD